MNINEFLTHINQRKPVSSKSEIHEFMVKLSNEAMKITSKLNSSYHEPEEVRSLFSELIGKKVDESFFMFPPFYTDCGKNITIGKNVFINSSCHFQDQGGLRLEIIRKLGIMWYWLHLTMVLHQRNVVQLILLQS